MARARGGERIAVLTDGPIVAAVRLRPIAGAHLLTGMLVHPAYRGCGLGHRLLEQIRPQLAQLDCFAFPYTQLAPFYRQHGFNDAHSLPAEIEQRLLAYRRQGRDIIAMRFN